MHGHHQWLYLSALLSQQKNCLFTVYPASQRISIIPSMSRSWTGNKRSESYLLFFWFLFGIFLVVRKQVVDDWCKLSRKSDYCLFVTFLWPWFSGKKTWVCWALAIAIELACLKQWIVRRYLLPHLVIWPLEDFPADILTAGARPLQLTRFFGLGNTLTSHFLQ